MNKYQKAIRVVRVSDAYNSTFGINTLDFMLDLFVFSMNSVILLECILERTSFLSSIPGNIAMVLSLFILFVIVIAITNQHSYNKVIKIVDDSEKIQGFDDFYVKYRHILSDISSNYEIKVLIALDCFANHLGCMNLDTYIKHTYGYLKETKNATS